MYKLFFCLAFSIGLLACNNDGKKTTTTTEDSTNLPAKDHTDTRLDTIQNASVELTDADIKDDSVFEDGSIPTSWENAGVNDPNQLKLFIKKLQNWAANDQRDSIAASIDYPLKSNKKITDAETFLSQYQQVMSAEVINALRAQKLSQIFRNAQGAMIGSGAIWIGDVSEDGSGDYKIISINN